MSGIDDGRPIHDLMRGPPPAQGSSSARNRTRSDSSVDENANRGARMLSSSSNGSSSYGNMHRVLTNEDAPNTRRENSQEESAIDFRHSEEHALILQQASGEIEQDDANARSNHQDHDVTGDNESDSGASSTNGENYTVPVDEEGVPIQSPYTAFVSSHLRIRGESVHPNRIPQGATWTKLTDAKINGMKPVRAMCINVPAALIQRDAVNFAEWTLPAGDGASRAFATAALTSALFAGTAMGIPCGNHAERQRAEAQNRSNSSGSGSRSGGGRKERVAELVDVDRYAYIPSTNQQDELPMFRIMYEEIKNRTDTDVTFIRVWILIFDETHSTSELLGQVITINSSLMRSQSASGQDPIHRSRGYTAEVERRRKSGFSSNNLHQNFESTVGMQYSRIHTMESYYHMLKLHAGNTVHNRGRMFVSDFEAHMDEAWGRRKLRGDLENGHGSYHPAAPEFVFNAKREESLRYGATNFDGSAADIHPKYLSTASYWNDDVFTIPVNSDIWMCASIDRRTIMELPLPRPLQNQVVPGDDLMRLFIEYNEEQKKALASFHSEQAGQNEGEGEAAEEAEEADEADEHVDESGNQGQGSMDDIDEADEEHEETAQDLANRMQLDDDSSGEEEDMQPMRRLRRIVVEDEVDDEQHTSDVQEEVQRPITSADHAAFRSFATGKDETQRRENEALRSFIQRFDSMNDSLVSNAVQGSDSLFLKGDKEGCYRIKTEKMTDRIATESSRIYSGIVNPWFVKSQRDIEDRRSKLEEMGCEDPEEFKKIDDDERANLERLHKVKRDLTQYHLRCLEQCYHSARDRTTLPSGYKAAHSQLEKLVKENGGRASMAFPPNKKGKQITAKDRQVWHELQEWLGLIFSKDALIEGRDRHIMVRSMHLISLIAIPTRLTYDIIQIYIWQDEMYLQSFDVYAEQRFVLIICSERGKGKSVRAERLGKLLPEGFAATQAASSARAGMNGMKNHIRTISRIQ